MRIDLLVGMATRLDFKLTEARRTLEMIDSRYFENQAVRDALQGYAVKQLRSVASDLVSFLCELDGTELTQPTDTERAEAVDQEGEHGDH